MTDEALTETLNRMSYTTVDVAGNVVCILLTIVPENKQQQDLINAKLDSILKTSPSLRLEPGLSHGLTCIELSINAGTIGTARKLIEFCSPQEPLVTRAMEYLKRSNLSEDERSAWRRVLSKRS